MKRGQSVAAMYASMSVDVERAKARLRDEVVRDMRAAHREVLTYVMPHARIMGKDASTRRHRELQRR